MHQAFGQAQLLGSLLHPSRAGEANLLAAGSEELAEFLGQALHNEEAIASEVDADQAVEIALTAKGLMEASQLLEARYHLVITNVPYKNLSELSDELKRLCAREYPDIKGDMANIFLERCLALALGNGVGIAQLVMPQNWLFLPTYQKQRESLLKRVQWNLLARLGAGAFETISGEVVQAILLTQTNAHTDPTHLIRGIDAGSPKSPSVKAQLLQHGELLDINQSKQLSNPGASIALEELPDLPPIGKWARVCYGSKPGQTARVKRCFWELGEINDREWMLMESSPSDQGTLSGT
jgi:hypothetical protein